jgi:hypothetical protein
MVEAKAQFHSCRRRPALVGWAAMLLVTHFFLGCALFPDVRSISQPSASSNTTTTTTTTTPPTTTNTTPPTSSSAAVCGPGYQAEEKTVGKVTLQGCKCVSPSCQPPPAPPPPSNTATSCENLADTKGKTLRPGKVCTQTTTQPTTESLFAFAAAEGSFAGLVVGTHSPSTTTLLATPGGTVTTTTPGGDPPVALPDAKFDAGATITVRTQPLGARKISLFARSGILVPLDGNSNATASEATLTAQAYNHEHFTVPLFAGVTVPATAVGIPIAKLSFEAFAGVQVKNRTMGFTWAGAGLPGGAISASGNFTTVDPAIGTGIQYYLGTFYGIPTSAWANVTIDRVVNSHTLYGDLSSSLTYPVHNSNAFAVGLNFDIPTNGAPAPPPIITKAH